MFEGVFVRGCLQQCLESACILKLWGDGLRVHVYGMSAAILRVCMHLEAFGDGLKVHVYGMSAAVFRF